MSVNSTQNKRLIISHDLADAIESFRADGWSNARIVSAAFIRRNGVTARSRTVMEYAVNSADTLLVALVNGYEREKTADEIAHERIYNAYSACHANAVLFHGGISNSTFADGIKFALNELGITIEGVNA